MQRCKQCETTLAKTDLACVNCGELVQSDKPKTGFRTHFGKLVTVLFILSAVLSVVALFTNYVGSFITCLAVTIVLLMVKKSADEMSSSQE
jgi:putative copper export protein